MTKELIIAFGIMGFCLVIHVMGIVVLGRELLRRRHKLEGGTSFTGAFLLIFVFLAVVVLHILEATIWAGFYVWSELFSDFETSLYFSLTSYSTLGYGDTLLPKTWRLLGTIEGITGVLLCGLSAAFLFVILNAFFQSRRN